MLYPWKVCFNTFVRHSALLCEGTVRIDKDSLIVVNFLFFEHPYGGVKRHLAPSHAAFVRFENLLGKNVHCIEVINPSLPPLSATRNIPPTGSETFCSVRKPHQKGDSLEFSILNEKFSSVGQASKQTFHG